MIEAVETPTVRSALAEAARRFAFSATPRLDAELLMAHAMGLSRDSLLLGHLDAPVPPGFAVLAYRRATHEPVAYITGRRAFWTIDLAVGPGVLIPRPDSETLIEAAVDHFANTPGPARVLDLGTGPGTLLLAALTEWPRAHGLGVDASAKALGYADRNARALGLADRVTIQLGDWATGITGPFDLILANPPYIGVHEALPGEVCRYEPDIALFAGQDGLAAYRVLATQIAGLLAPGGLAAVEIGSTQADAVVALFEAQRLVTRVRHDLAGRPRAVLATP